jgi:hypothetical protein
MCSIEIHKFFLSYKLDGEVHTGWFAGINLRYAKEKLHFQFSEATDIMDWTHEKSEDLRLYLNKQKAKEEQIHQHLLNKEVDQV